METGLIIIAFLYLALSTVAIVNLFSRVATPPADLIELETGEYSIWKLR